jgi:hypothetical protein
MIVQISVTLLFTKFFVQTQIKIVNAATKLGYTPKQAALFVFIMCWILGALFHFWVSNLPSSQRSSMEPSKQVVIAGFELYSDKSKGLQILFPGQPEITNFKVGEVPVTHYKAVSVIDDANFTQYSVSYSDTEIYSTRAIDAYLNSYVKGKAVGGLSDDAMVVTNTITKYKGFPAREYLIEYTSEGLLIKYKGVVFVANGDPIDLSISYPATMDAGKTYFNEFSESFELR